MDEFSSLYERFSADVYRFAFYLCGNSTEAEDITSETFVRAWVSRESIQVETVKGYLFAIAKNFFLKNIRSATRHPGQPQDIRDSSPDAQELVEHREELNAVLKAMRALQPIDRAALIMRTLHDLPYAEIARVLDISESAAKVRVHRARAVLMKFRGA
jgi:RNA polymerase sigma-70 factor, ECF subfamily